MFDHDMSYLETMAPRLEAIGKAEDAAYRQGLPFAESCRAYRKTVQVRFTVRARLARQAISRARGQEQIVMIDRYNNWVRLGESCL